MFSPQIQNYINSSSQTQAYNRVNEINNYINSFYPAQKISEEKSTGAFKQILAESKDNVRKESVFELDPPPNIKEKTIKFGSLTGIKSASSKTKSAIIGYIKDISNKYGVDEKLVQAVIKQESGYNPDAVSKVGAKGLMQLMPSTAAAMGVKNILDPRENIEGGVKYLKQMLDKYNGNKILALAAYNAGPGAVDKYSGVPPYKETQNYVKSILAQYL